MRGLSGRAPDAVDSAPREARPGVARTCHAERHRQLGISFYSWIEITLSPEPDPKAKGAYKLIFRNDLEPNRESIRWKTFIAPVAR